MIKAIFLFGFSVGLMATAQTVIEEVKLEAFGSTRTQWIEADKGQVLSIRPKREGELVPAVFVYQREAGLAAKNEESADSSSFEWTVPERGHYQIVLYSNSEVTVNYTFSLLPPEPTRAGTSLKTPVLARVPVYYSTNRELKSIQPVRFSTEPKANGALSYGSVEVSIPLDHKMGHLEYPYFLQLLFSAEPDPSKHFFLGSQKLTEPQKFFKEVSRLALRSDERDALVFVHGFNTSFENAALRTAQLAYDLNFKGPAVMFSWPSQDAIGLTDYNKDKRNADLSSRALRDFLFELTERTEIHKIHVIAHSMGNQVLSQALSKIGPAQSSIREIALIAPDIDAALFRQLAQEFPKSTDRIALYASSRDLALLAARKLVGYPRAGEGGKDIVVIPGIDSIDASSVDTSVIGFRHQYYADNRELLGDLYWFFRGEPAEKRFALKPSRDRSYWIFSP